MESSRGIKMEKTHEKQDSIKLNRTSKGVYSWKIKIYFEDESSYLDEWKNGETIIERIKELDKKLTKTFINPKQQE